MSQDDTSSSDESSSSIPGSTQRSPRSPRRSPRPGSPNFTGKWKLKDSDNFDPFLQDCNVGIIKRTAAKYAASEHHIEQDGDHMKVTVKAAGFSTGKQQDYEVGDSFSETEINGEQAEVETEWSDEGDGIRELHRSDSFEYILVRELPDEDTMVLNLESSSGTKAKRIYKRME